MSARSFMAKQRLTSLLASVPTIEGESGRAAVLSMLRDLNYDLPQLPGENIQIICYSMVAVGARQPGLLQQLANVIEGFDQSNQARSFSAEVRSHLPGDFFALDERMKFIEEMSALIEPAKFHMYFTGATGDACPVELDSVETLLRELEELGSTGTCHPLILLTEEVASQAPKSSARRVAKHWSERLADLIDESEPDKRGRQREKLAAFRKAQSKSERPDPGVDQVTLTLLLDPYMGNPGAGYLLSAWLFYRDGLPQCLRATETPVSLEAIREILIEELKSVIHRLSRPDAELDVRVEFFLPRSLMDYAVEDWLDDDGVTLGSRFVVLVRDRDRLRNEIVWPVWKRKWNHLMGGRNGHGGPLSGWITCNDALCRSGELSHKLLGDEFVSLGMTFPPGVLRIELEEALKAGLPAAVWPRARCPHPVPVTGGEDCLGTAFQDSVLLALGDRDVADLPLAVQQLRRAANGGAGPGVALLWDNAARCPPTGDDFPLDVPYTRSRDERMANLPRNR
jgi:NTP-dependent ternary conflict system VMAP-like protein